MKTVARLSVATCICIVSAAPIVPIRGEEMLEKETTKFLGWQTSKTEFITCSKNRLQIEPGKVIKTNAKCEGPIFVSKERQIFIVQSVDENSRMVRMSDRKGGGEVSMYYPKFAEQPTTLKLEGMKPGQVIGVEFIEAEAPGYGRLFRAEAIKESDRTKWPQ